MQRFKDINITEAGGPLKRAGLTVILISLMLLAASCATRRSEIPVDAEIELERTSFTFSMNEHPFDLFTEYRIVPGDILDVLFQFSTWLKREDFKLEIDHTIQIRFVYAPELDIEQRAKPNGYITLHYIGDVYIVGKTVEELKKELQQRYKDILQIPEITVIVPEFRANIKELKADLHTAPRGLSRLVTVRPDGYVTFPMVGDVFVARKTIPEVNKILNDMYDKIMPGLHCDLFLETAAGSDIYVLGEVNKPGVYSIPRPITVLEALAMAGSYTSGAQLDSVFIIRKQEKILVATRIDLANTLSLDVNSKFFYLMANDIIYVPKTWLRDSAEVARDIADVLFFKGWSLGMSKSISDFPVRKREKTP